MDDKIIETVSKAEKQAEELIEKARLEALSIIDAAKLESEKIKSQIIEDSIESNHVMMAVAQKEIEHLKSEFDDKIQKDIANFKQKMTSRVKQASERLKERVIEKWQ